MNSFFGIGLAELVVILILAGLLIGPKGIRQVAQTLGKYTAQLQIISRQFTRQLNAELDALDMEELRGAVEDVRELQREVQSLRNELNTASRQFMQEGKTAVQEAEDSVRSISPYENNIAGPEESNPPDQRLEDGVAPEQMPLPKALDIPDDPEV